MTVRKVQFETMDEVNRFLDVTEHFPFAVDLKRGHRTVNGKINSRSCIYWSWKRNGFLRTCAGTCAGDYIQS